MFDSNECYCLVQLLWGEREMDKKMIVFRQSRLQSVSWTENWNRPWPPSGRLVQPVTGRRPLFRHMADMPTFHTHITQVWELHYVMPKYSVCTYSSSCHLALVMQKTSINQSYSTYTHSQALCLQPTYILNTSRSTD